MKNMEKVNFVKKMNWRLPERGMANVLHVVRVIAGKGGNESWSNTLKRKHIRQFLVGFVAGFGEISVTRQNKKATRRAALVLRNDAFTSGCRCTGTGC